MVAVESFESLPGRGVVATLSGIKVCKLDTMYFNQQSHTEIGRYIKEEFSVGGYFRLDSHSGQAGLATVSLCAMFIILEYGNHCKYA